ncbi:17917_t:CDS:2 [Funneliformis geosporum]|nr:17917_t:CDS:2 [Funneliformis geosporum]
MPEKRVETGDVSFLYTEVNDRQEIKDIVFSPDMTYMVTSDNKVYEMWTVELDNNKITKYKDHTLNDSLKSLSLLRLSDNKLLISGFEIETGYYSLIILDLDMETLEHSTINPNYGNFLQFLPNGNLLLLREQYIYVFTETTLKKDSPYKYSSKYCLRIVDDRINSQVVDFRNNIQMKQINGQIFFTLENSIMIIQLNTEDWTIKNKYILPGKCDWIGAVNNDESLFAICLKQANNLLLCVYSIMDGILISSRQVKFKGNDINIRFIDSNNTEVLMLYSLDKEIIRYVVTDPYELSYTCEYKYDIQNILPNGIYTITKLPTSQYNEKILRLLIEHRDPDKNDKIIKKLYDNELIIPNKNNKIINKLYDKNDEMIIKLIDNFLIIDDDGNDDDGNYDDENDDDENDDDKNDDKNDDYEIDEMIIKIYDNVFIVPDKNTEKLYNNSKLSIYSRFKEIKEIKNYYKESVKINKNEKEIRVVGKKLRWVFSELNNLLSVFNKTKYLKGVKGNYPLAVKKLVQLDLKPYELKILDDHDVIFYNKSRIIIFGLKSKKIVMKYLYRFDRDVNKFFDCKRLPCPNFNFYENDEGYEDFEEDKKNMIMELLHANTYIIEMSDQIIDFAIMQQESEILDGCLGILYGYLTDDTVTLLAHFKIYGIITNVLQRLNSEFLIHYLDFLSKTSIIQNPYITKSYLSKKSILVGYTDHANSVQIYRCCAKQYFQNFLNLIIIQSYFKLNIVIQDLYNTILRNFNIAKFKNKKVISFVIPYLGFTKYPPKYNFWMELSIPQANLFIELDDQAFYESWNAEAIVNFKWNTFGKYYYRFVWGIFTVFLLSFGLASTLSSSVTTENLLYLSIFLGVFHMLHELRQFVWDWKAYITDLWNWFDLAAYIFPVYTAIFWLNRGKPQLPLISISNLFLHFKFITFLRALDYFGSNFTIIVGVARRIFSFLLILFLILIGFAHAFYIILTPNGIYDMNHPVMNDDPNNPWNLVDKYQSVSPDGSEIVYSKLPDSNVNQFTTYKTSLLAMYLFLTGNPSALDSWTYLENPFMTILLTMFSFLIVVYLMNLFIGLLNLEIDNHRTHYRFILEKKKILAEIEIFLLLPNQRRWSHWFPDLIFYEMPIEKVRQKIIEIDNSLSDVKYISLRLRNLAEMKNEIPKTEGSEVLSKKVETKIEKSNSEGCEILLKKFEDLEAKFKPLLDHIALEINNE